MIVFNLYCRGIGTQRSEHGEPLYTPHTDINRPRLSGTEFWKQRGGLTSYSDLQEDFFNKISRKYGAVRGQSTSLLKNTNKTQGKARQLLQVAQERRRF